MAKKKTPRRPRSGVVGPDEVMQLSKLLEKLATDCALLSKEMADDGYCPTEKNDGGNVAFNATAETTEWYYKFLGKFRAWQTSTKPAPKT